MSYSVSGQVEKVLDKTIIKYLTPDRIPNHTRTDIKYAAYYNPNSGNFHHDGNGLDFDNAHTAPVIALVDKQGTPYYLRIRGGGFQVSYRNDRFEPATFRSIIEVSFKGWDGTVHTLHVNQLPIWEGKAKKEAVIASKRDESCSYSKTGSYNVKQTGMNVDKTLAELRRKGRVYCQNKGGMNNNMTRFQAGTTYKQHGNLFIDWSAKVTCNCTQ